MPDSEWRYFGTHLDLPEGSWIIFGYRGWSWGAPYGMRLTTSATDMSSDKILLDLGFTDPRMAISGSILIGGPTTVYLWSRAITGSTSESMYALKMKYKI